MVCPHCKIERAKCQCCCSAECPYLDDGDTAPGGVCEGHVEAVDEELIEDENGDIVDSYWVHYCQKHAARYYERGF